MSEATAQPRRSSEHLLKILLHLRVVDGEKREGMRGRILEQAITEFTGRGYAGTSMRQIAEGCGIKAASLYAHFPDGKEQLLREALRDIFDEFLAHLVKPITVDMDDETQFRVVVRQHITWQLRRKAVAWDAAVRQFGVAEILDQAGVARERERQEIYHSYMASLIASLRNESNVRDRMTAVVILCDQAPMWLDPLRPAAEQEDEIVERVGALVHDLAKGA